MSSIDSEDSIKGILDAMPDWYVEKYPFEVRLFKAKRIYMARARSRDEITKAGFDPQQLRGKAGKWSKVGTGSGTAGKAGDRPGKGAAMPIKKARKLHKHVKDNGGFTIKFGDFDHYDGKGFAVGVGALFGGAIVKKFKGMGAVRLSKHISKIKSEIKSKVMASDKINDDFKSRVHIGGWLQEGEIHVEPSIVFPRDKEAVAKALGKDLGEEGIFDFSTFETVFL